MLSGLPIRLYHRLYAAYEAYKLNQARAQGLQAPDDLICYNLPEFGSEPWLITIGRGVEISSGVTFLTHDGGAQFVRKDPRFRRAFKYGRIEIKDNCFIGYRAVIMPNVTIGPNAIVGVNSVVTKDVPPNTVAAGIPARPIMTLEEYAERIVARSPDWDPEAFARDSRAELLRLYPFPE